MEKELAKETKESTVREVSGRTGKHSVMEKAIEERVSSGKETSNLIPGLRLYIEFLLQ